MFRPLAQTPRPGSFSGSSWPVDHWSILSRPVPSRSANSVTAVFRSHTVMGAQRLVTESAALRSNTSVRRRSFDSRTNSTLTSGPSFRQSPTGRPPGLQMREPQPTHTITRRSYQPGTRPENPGLEPAGECVGVGTALHGLQARGVRMAGKNAGRPAGAVCPGSVAVHGRCAWATFRTPAPAPERPGGARRSTAAPQQPAAPTVCQSQAERSSTLGEVGLIRFGGQVGYAG